MNIQSHTPGRLTVAALVLSTSVLCSVSHGAEEAAAPEARGWISRMASAPAKLAFWKKDAPAEAAPPAAEAAPEKVETKKIASKSKKAARARTEPTGKPAVASAESGRKASKKRTGADASVKPEKKAASPAADASPADAAMASEPAKKPFWKRLNPFAKDGAAAEPQPEVAETKPAAKPSTKKSDRPEKPTAKPEKLAKADKPATKKKDATPAPEAETPAEPKRGFFARFWPGKETKAPEVAPTADEPAKKMAKKDVKAKKMGPEAPATVAKKTEEAKPSKKGNAEAAQVADAEPKRSFWSRILPSKKDEPKRVVRSALNPPAEALTPDTFVVTKDESPFYSFGPQQGPPEAYLGTGTLVTMTKKSWGWAEVKLSDGRTGLVARNAVRQASENDILPPATRRQLFAAAPVTVRRATPSYVIPPAPLPELPTAPAVDGPGVSDEVLSAALLPPVNE